MNVVASFDGTVVTVIPSVATNFEEELIPIKNIQLNKDESYQLRSEGDLSGTIVTSSLPVSVISGTTMAKLPINATYTSGIDKLNSTAEQNISSQNLGTSFVLAPHEGQGPNLLSHHHFQVVGSRNFTTVTVHFASGISETHAVNRGDHYEEPYWDGPVYITSNKPISVAQFTLSSRVTGDKGDPTMSIVPSTELFDTACEVLVPGPITAVTQDWKNYITVFAPIGHVLEYKMDNDSWATLSGTTVTVPGSEYECHQLTVPAGGDSSKYQFQDTASVGDKKVYAYCYRYDASGEKWESTATFGSFKPHLDGGFSIDNQPVTPVHLGASPLSTSEIALSWAHDDINTDGFFLYKKLHSGGTWERFAIVAPGTHDAIADNLSVATKYDFMVVAFNDVNSDVSNRATARTLPDNDLLPTNLRMGLNISYLFGNVGFRLMRNEHPYEQSRLLALFRKDPNGDGDTSDSDFMKVLHAHSTTQGFDHIRLPIDPASLGVDPVTGHINWNSNVPQSNSTATQNMAALNTVVTEAVESGLAVIIDYHPIYLNQAQYLNEWNATTGHTTDNNANIYPSMLMNNYVTFDGDNNPIGSSHKLSAFWADFLGYVSTHFNWPSDKVYFEILNEPLVNANIINLPNPDIGIEYQLYFRKLMKDWRDIQLGTLKVCQEIMPGHKFIVTAATVDPRELGVASWDQLNVNWGNSALRLPIMASYSLVEIAAGKPLAEQIALRGNLIYNVHEYQPLSYTHYNYYNVPFISTSEQKYLFGRDYYGFDIPINYNGIDYDAKYDSVSRGLVALNEWQVSNTDGAYVPPILMTEGGVLIRSLAQDCLPDECQVDGSHPEEVLQRRQWHYDVRTSIHLRSYGISWYELVGNMGLYVNPNVQRVSFSVSNSNGPCHGHGTWSVLDSEMNVPFWGTSRP